MSTQNRKRRAQSRHIRRSFSHAVATFSKAIARINALTPEVFARAEHQMRSHTVSAEGAASGLRFMVWELPTGYRNGYVEVPPDHPFFGKEFDHIAADLEVHGGLTFSGSIYTDTDWWLGFDCHHWLDKPDPTIVGGAHLPFLGLFPSDNFGEIRSNAYVENECRGLARQIAQYFDGTTTP